MAAQGGELSARFSFVSIGSHDPITSLEDGMKTESFADVAVLVVCVAGAAFIVGLQYGLSLIGCGG